MVDQSWMDTLARQLKSGIIAIDGPSGAGKSTFADALVSKLEELRTRVVLIRTDDFATWDEPVGWWPELEEEVLRSYWRGHDFRFHPRVWRDGSPQLGPRVWLRWEPLLIIEGVSSARVPVRRHLKRALWVDGGTEEQRLERAVARDGESERDNLRRWQDFERGWFAVDRTRDYCEIVPEFVLDRR
jgi:energy-coupling factor transporter ATP-binding protein EcfA2